jgi:hypothetical protein
LNKGWVAMNKVVLGNVIEVQNKENSNYSLGRNQASVYLAIQVEDANGDNERCLLITHKEYTKYSTRFHDSELLDVMVTSRLYKSVLEKAEVVTVKVMVNGEEDCLMIPVKYLQKIEKRTKIHKDTITKKDFLTDLLD